MITEDRESGRYFTDKDEVKKEWLGSNRCEKCGRAWLLADFPGWANERKTKLKNWRCDACLDKG